MKFSQKGNKKIGKKEIIQKVFGRYFLGGLIG